MGVDRPDATAEERHGQLQSGRRVNAEKRDGQARLPTLGARASTPTARPAHTAVKRAGAAAAWPRRRKGGKHALLRENHAVPHRGRPGLSGDRVGSAVYNSYQRYFVFPLNEEQQTLQLVQKT